MYWTRFHDSDGQPAWAGRETSDQPWRLGRGDPLQGGALSEQAVQPGPPLPPVLQPPAVLCIGLNYRAHAEETGARLPERPVLFMKNPAAVIAHGQAIVLPTRTGSAKVDFEAELAVIIGRPAKDIPEDDALSVVAGYTCANDVSARDWQKEWGGGQWCRGKSFDSFCPLGPVVASPAACPDPGALRVIGRLNGEVMQDGCARDLVFPIPRLIAFLSSGTTLLPGTVILTGTPAGVGIGRTPPRWLAPGDVYEVEIPGIGRLANPVVSGG